MHWDRSHSSVCAGCFWGWIAYAPPQSAQSEAISVLAYRIRSDTYTRVKGGILIARYYQKDKDYSDAIASETDAGKRETLLAERQNKIDSEGLAGKVASNDSVSTWTGGYRPYSVSSGSSRETGTVKNHSYSIAGLYEAIERSRLQAFERARKENRRALERQREQIDQQYTDSSRQTQINSRLTAMGNEEKLAALGLSAGGRYESPTSGYTESERVRMDNTLRSNLNQLAAARDSAKAQAAQAAAATDIALQTQDAQSARESALSLAQIAMQQGQNDQEYALKSAAMTGYLNGSPTLDLKKYQTEISQSAEEQGQKQQRVRYEDALTRWKTYGYVLPTDAAMLGVPAGTGTSDQRYRDAQNRLAQLRLAK